MNTPFDETTLEQRTDFNEWLSEHWSKLPVDFNWTRQHDTNKCVASERTIEWSVNAEEVLKRFSRMCALDVIHLWDAPDVVIKYLKTGDEKLRDAAWDAARRKQSRRLIGMVTRAKNNV